MHYYLRNPVNTPSIKQISAQRLLLMNQYAFLDGDGNLSADPVCEATLEQISASRRLYKNPHAYDDGSGHLSAVVPSKPSTRTEGIETKPYQPANESIERAVKELKEMIWRRRKEVWPDGDPDDLVEFLNPSVALMLLGYEFSKADSLGQFYSNGMSFEVAGILDRTNKSIQISRQMAFETQSFTAAHELGHAVLHENMSMHRDRPLDGSKRENVKRDKVEKEADKFASLFLMPEKLVRPRFRRLFLCDKFTLNDNTRYALDPSESMGAHEDEISSRVLARMLASATSFNGHYFHSLADQFHVSIEAMAIRLEELQLLEV